MMRAHSRAASSFSGSSFVALAIVCLYLSCFAIQIKVVSARGCIKNLADINSAEAKLGDFRTTRVYVLCPNTDFVIARDFDYASGKVSGKQEQPPLTLYNPNVKITCGRDAKSENHCTFKGGSTQLLIASSKVFDDLGANTHQRRRRDVPLNGIEISGVTFQDSDVTNVSVVSPGRITFTDCRFVENTNESVLLVADYFSVLNEDHRRRLNGGRRQNGNRPNSGSRRVPLNAKPIKVTLNQCRFEDNALDFGEKGMDFGGLVTAIGPKTAPTRVDIVESTFTRNDFSYNGEISFSLPFGEKSKPFGDEKYTYLVGNMYGEMIIKRSCFRENSVNMGLVTNNLGKVQSGQNFQQDNDAGDNGCPGVARVTRGDLFAGDLRRLAFNCLQFRGKKCFASTASDAECFDLPGKVFGSRIPTRQERGCRWLAAQPNRANYYCSKVRQAREACPETCNVCQSFFYGGGGGGGRRRGGGGRRRGGKGSGRRDRGYNANIQKPPKCLDDKHAKFPFVAHVPQECAWLEAGNRNRRNQYCVKGTRAYRNCPKTCGAC